MRCDNWIDPSKVNKRNGSLLASALLGTFEALPSLIKRDRPKPGCDPMRTDLRAEQVIWAAADMIAIEFSEETTDSAAKQKEAEKRYL